MLRRGHTLVPFEETADAYIVNTCSVTAVSDKKSRQMIRRCRKLNDNAVVAACGCYVQTHPDEAAGLEHGSDCRNRRPDGVSRSSGTGRS